MVLIIVVLAVLLVPHIRRVELNIVVHLVYEALAHPEVLLVPGELVSVRPSLAPLTGAGLGGLGASLLTVRIRYLVIVGEVELDATITCNPAAPIGAPYALLDYFPVLLAV